jgi:tetratricopeptide (TPR) repeat protein
MKLILNYNLSTHIDVMVIYFWLRRLKLIFCLLPISLLISPWIWSDSTLLTIGKQAEKLFAEQLYGDALPLYSQLLALPTDEELRTQFTLRLATCYLEEGHPQTSLALLSPLATCFHHNECLYLMSLAYRKLGKSYQALDLLQQCSLLHDSQYAKNLIALEKGFHFIQIGDFSNAQLMFEKIPWQKNDALSYYLAQLHLARIYLATHQFDTALQILRLLAHHLPQDHLLNIERVYLKGWLLLAKHQNSQAADCFEELLPKALMTKAEWSIQVLNGLIMSYLRQTLAMESASNQLQILLSKTDVALQQLLIRAPNETSHLLLSDFYLIKAKCLNDPLSYAQAQQLLERKDLFCSAEGRRHALLKYAEAAPSYQARHQLYEQLSKDPQHPQAFCAKVWFLKGLNHFEEGLNCQKQQVLHPTTWPFELASQAFAQAFQLQSDRDYKQAALALKYQALAYVYQPGLEKTQQAWQTIHQLIEDPLLLSAFEYPQEIYCLAAWIALHLTQTDILQQAKAFLQQVQENAKPLTVWKERCLKLEGLLCLQLQEWQQAETLFAHLIQDYPYFSSHGEAWFWRAYCAEQQKDHSLKKEYLQQVYTQDPQSTFAPIAYFQVYSYRDYMHGQRKAIKHLQAMPLLFPSHALLISAHYLIGLNHKKDHLSEEGQLLHRKDWIAAIEAFQLAESTFDNLFEKNLIPPTHLPYFIQVRYRAQLERAQANLAIAQSSVGGKRQIYLEYAEGVFKQLIKDFTTPYSLAMEGLVHSLASYPKIWREAEFKLAQTYKEKKWLKEAEALLDQSLEHYRQAQVVYGYGLMRVWYEKGKLAQERTDHQIALRCFIEAEKATPEYVGLSPTEKLDLWIQQSLCYKALNQLDHAMRLLSRVINDDVISPLRIKAMFLRSEIYELQGRPELAIKQLEATARKGGEWAQKAQEKLEYLYGY